MEHISRMNIASEELLSISVGIWKTPTFLQREKENKMRWVSCHSASNGQPACKQDSDKKE